MKYIVIDTCVIINIIKGTEVGARCLEAIRQYDDNYILSTVTKAELESIILQNEWGERRKKALQVFLNNSIYIDILNSDADLINAYKHIDAYSNRKAPDKNGNILQDSSKIMGKNDLWIAATAYVLDLPFYTTDGDFDHLNGTLINVVKIV